MTMKKLRCITRCWRLIFFKHVALSLFPLLAGKYCCSLQNGIPFAVIGSNFQVESKGRMVRGRTYPWGAVEGNVAEMATFWLYIHTRFRNSCVLVGVACVSGGSTSLWLPVAEEHAGEDIHAGPEGCDTGEALWKLQGRAHPQNDTNGKESQVGGSSSTLARATDWMLGWYADVIRPPSLLQKYQDDSEVDFALQLVSSDDERERLTHEKDEEVRLFITWLTCFSE